MARFGVPTKHTALIVRAVGTTDDPEVQIVEALTRSLFLDLKANFELFLVTCCRAWLRHDQPEAIERVAACGFRGLKDFVAKMRAADRSNEEWEELIPVQGLPKLVAVLNALSGSKIEQASHWNQVSVSFSVRHLVEHRNGRVDDRFIDEVKERWLGTSWGARLPALPTRVQVTEADFEATYEAMQASAASVTERLIGAWRSR